jgi:hypothetical protein
MSVQAKAAQPPVHTELGLEPEHGIPLRREGKTLFVVLEPEKEWTFDVQNKSKVIRDLAVEYTDPVNPWKTKPEPLCPTRWAVNILRPTGPGDLIVMWGDERITIEVRIEGEPE